MNEAVLDASALMAVINSEAGGQAVAQIINRVSISTVNLAEVIGKMIDQGTAPDAAVIIVGQLPVQVISFDEGLAIRAGMLRAQTRPAGLSLGDRACLALAEREKLPALTSDQAWSRVALPIQIKFIR